MPKDFMTFVVLVVLVLLLYQVGMRYVLTYRLTNEDVRAVLFGVGPVSIRRYRFITEVHTTSFLEGDFFPWHGAYRISSLRVGRS